jgi:hypothetical protein
MHQCCFGFHKCKSAPWNMIKWNHWLKIVGKNVGYQPQRLPSKTNRNENLRSLNWRKGNRERTDWKKWFTENWKLNIAVVCILRKDGNTDGHNNSLETRKNFGGETKKHGDCKEFIKEWEAEIWRI